MLSRRQLMNDKMVSAQGENLSLANVKGSKLNALSVYGKSTQDGTPSPENPVPIVSAGSVMTTGAQLFDIKKATPCGSAYGLTVSIDGEEIKISGTVSSVPDDGGALAFRILNYPENLYGNTFSADIVDDTGVQDCDIYGEQSENAIAIVIGKIPIGTEVNLVFRLMVNSGSTALPWEPYTGGVPGVNPYDGEINVSVSDGGTQSQTLTLSTPGGLPGIPVFSGGNYTDENGQQWICDEIDLKRGKYVQRVGKVELDGTEAWVLQSGSGDLEQPYFHLANSIDCGTSLKGYSNYFPVVLILSNNAEQGVGGWENTMYLRWTELFSTVEDLKSFLSEKYTSGNPVRAYYILATPIETDLPAEEIAAYKALHTYTPNTSVGNDADAGVKIGYREYKN